MWPARGSLVLLPHRFICAGPSSVVRWRTAALFGARAESLRAGGSDLIGIEPGLAQLRKLGGGAWRCTWLGRFRRWRGLRVHGGRRGWLGWWGDLRLCGRRLERYPTRAAIDKLAARFGLPNEPRMQDWEWEVADAGRIDEFLTGYCSGELSEDECFTLMETLIESFEDLCSAGTTLESDPRWARLLALLDDQIALHIKTVWYWSVEDSSLEDAWRVTPFMRTLLAKHRTRFEMPPSK